MAEICCGVLSESEASKQCEPSSRSARRKRMEIRRIRIVGGVPVSELESGEKRQKIDNYLTSSFSRNCENAIENCCSEGEENILDEEISNENQLLPTRSLTMIKSTAAVLPELPKFGMASVCGRRRDMEDAVAIYPSFFDEEDENASKLHYFGVFDGHGCSHVAMKCRDRLHELVKEELGNRETTSEWKNAMERSFYRMDKEVTASNESVVGASCRCELRTPECDAVGSTAVVAIVTPDKIIVANCGDSRAVLCRNGKAVPLSSDHKPDRPDELQRIQSAGGRVIYWEGPRVLGVLAMSRAIGDNYLKPYVSCVPEVTITDRTGEDECLILASDGLWDVVSNDVACGVARMCLRSKASPTPDSPNSDKACADASMLLTKLALARYSTDNVSVVVVDLRKGT